MLLNRNLIQLVRRVCAARPVRLNTIKPGNLGFRFYCCNKTPSNDKSACNPCPDEPPEFGCNTPTSKIPVHEAEEVNCQCPSVCPPPMCNIPAQNPPCAPVCDDQKKEEPKPQPKSKLLLFLLLLSVFVAVAIGVYAYQEQQKEQESPQPEECEPADKQKASEAKK